MLCTHLAIDVCCEEFDHPTILAMTCELLLKQQGAIQYGLTATRLPLCV